MKTKQFQKNQAEAGAILIYFIFALVIIASIASVSSLALNTVKLAHRRDDMIRATQLAEGSAALASMELEKAYTNTQPFAASLVANAAGAYILNTTLGGGLQKVYERTITSPFTAGNLIKAQIWYTNATTPASAKVIGIATVGSVTQTATVQLKMRFGYAAAILSDSPGTASTGIDKNTGKQGNVVIDGSSAGTVIIDGGEGYAILANGRANIDTTYASVPPNAISMTNYHTANEVPDYTLEGSPNQLFDFPRFIAVADLTPSGPSKSNNNHFASLPEFKASLLTNSPAKPYYGVVVVDIKQADIAEITTAHAPQGINVRGTLLFNFAADVAGASYLKNSATVNINPANLATVNAMNPASFTTGYPPVYPVLATAKNPININIASKGFANFQADDDLPAMMYSIGVFDIHGNANICGVIYTPSFVEIENKNDNQVQYFRGSIIGGGGVYVENTKASKTMVSYDKNALDYLATSGNKGKLVSPIFWQ